jgi:glutamine amidotransferase-like uncharacterized protein
MASTRPSLSFATVAAVPPGFSDRLVSSAAIIEGSYGNGRVVLVAPHPEFTPGLGRLTLALIYRAAGYVYEAPT